MHSYAMMGAAHAIHYYGYLGQPYLLKDDVFSLYDKMSVQTKAEQKVNSHNLRYFFRRNKLLYGDYP